MTDADQPDILVPREMIGRCRGRKALVTGVYGQDGSYMVDYLLELGYNVWAAHRPSMTRDDVNLRHRLGHPRLTMAELDIADPTQIDRVISRVRPHEIYNFAALSRVGPSFESPGAYFLTNNRAVAYIAAAIEHFCPNTRLFQASTSEMWGTAPPPQGYDTPFQPDSPYAIAKLAAHWFCINERRRGLYLACGISSNHECVDESMPIMVRQDGLVDILPVGELMSFLRRGPSSQTVEPEGLDVWDGDGWTDVKAITATRRNSEEVEHEGVSVEARGGAVTVTAHHRMLYKSGVELAAVDLAEGDDIALARRVPPASKMATVSAELAELLGFLAADGYVCAKQIDRIQFTNNDRRLRDRVAALWGKLFLGTSMTKVGPSGWKPDRTVCQLYLQGVRGIGRWIRSQLYTKAGHKRVPKLILNAGKAAREAFLRGYYAGDGLKAHTRVSYTTNSPTLAQGVLWLYANLGKTTSVYIERRDSHRYYRITAHFSARRFARANVKNHAAILQRVRPEPEISDWVFDLETESGKFCVGVGRLIAHNSPRRGRYFVTRKIVDGLRAIKHNVDESRHYEPLRLGNLTAKRDFGYAAEFVAGYWALLQEPEPLTAVFGTGVSITVEDFLLEAARVVGFGVPAGVEGHPGQEGWQLKDYRGQVIARCDSEFFRPMEPSEFHVSEDALDRTFKMLGWRALVKGAQVIAKMVERPETATFYSLRRDKEVKP